MAAVAASQAGPCVGGGGAGVPLPVVVLLLLVVGLVGVAVARHPT